MLVLLLNAIVRHISIIGAKLKKLLPENASDKVEDLEDHYERLLQMRVSFFGGSGMSECIPIFCGLGYAEYDTGD